VSRHRRQLSRDIVDIGLSRLAALRRLRRSARRGRGRRVRLTRQ